MSNASSHGRKEPRIISNKNINAELEAGCIGSRRLSQIERLFGVRIINLPSEVTERTKSAETSYHEQAIRLLHAFELITDVKVRSDVLAMVIAAAQHEHEPD